MCRVCLKRPEIPDERYGRCESCAKNGRIALRFRLGPRRDGTGLVVRAGELSPRALRQKWREPLAAFAGHPAAKPHLGLHELEMVTARDRLEFDQAGARPRNPRPGGARRPAGGGRAQRRSVVS